MPITSEDNIELDLVSFIAARLLGVLKLAADCGVSFIAARLLDVLNFPLDLVLLINAGVLRTEDLAVEL
jgi:hypothetical protein